MDGRIISLAKSGLYIPESFQTREGNLTKENLLQYYVKEGSSILLSLDNLGNFLMGFGVLMLGYLLSLNVRPYFTPFSGAESLWSISSLALLAWVSSVVFLLGFMYLFIYKLIVGRSIYAHGNHEESIGKEISLREMSYHTFVSSAPTFDAFLGNNYLMQDQSSEEQLWYATFRYHRYMAFRKLMVMNKMRLLLAWAMVSGILFKILDMIVA